MYLSFYGLREKPFNTTPDPDFLYLTPGHREALAQLQLPELRQRIGLHCRISPLRPEETRDYIRSRLRIAGAPDHDLFTDRAVARIRDYAGGIPRVVNILCDHSLLFGYADQQRRIDRETVEQAIAYLQGKQPRRPARETAWSRGMPLLRQALWAVPAALGAVVAVAALDRDALRAVSGFVTVYLSDFARAVREFLVR